MIASFMVRACSIEKAWVVRQRSELSPQITASDGGDPPRPSGGGEALELGGEHALDLLARGLGGFASPALTGEPPSDADYRSAAGRMPNQERLGRVALVCRRSSAHWHRSEVGTSPSTCSMWLPHPL